MPELMSSRLASSCGMSEKLGPRVLGHSQGAPFLGRDLHSEPDYSDETARQIDAEIRRIIDDAYARGLATPAPSTH